MKKITKMTREEVDAIFAMDEIDPEKNAIEIVSDPSAFFLPYLNKSQNNATTILMKFTIFNILRSIDSSMEIGKNTSQYFMSNYTIDEWLDKLEIFYNYVMDTADYIISQHDNAMLDLYNDGRIGKESMEKAIMSFAKVQKQLTEDKETLKQWIKEIDEERKKYRNDDGIIY